MTGGDFENSDLPLYKLGNLSRITADQNMFFTEDGRLVGEAAMSAGDRIGILHGSRTPVIPWSRSKVGQNVICFVANIISKPPCMVRQWIGMRMKPMSSFSVERKRNQCFS